MTASNPFYRTQVDVARFNWYTHDEHPTSLITRDMRMVGRLVRVRQSKKTHFWQEEADENR